MSKRVSHILIWVLIALLLACVGVFVWLIRPEPLRPGIIPENVERVTPGMTIEEVSKLFDSPYPTTVTPKMAGHIGLSIPEKCRSVLFLSGEECDIFIYMDSDNRAISAEQSVGTRGKIPAWQWRLERRLRQMRR